MEYTLQRAKKETKPNIFVANLLEQIRASTV